jgi:Tfp pilus assembly protein PilF
MASKQEEALRLLEEGNKYQKDGDTDRAIESYRRSIEVHPTADAHTYLGWMLSFKGEIDAAIAQCKIAIELDPDFGNPYNDIGVYLMQQGKLDEAESWLRRATAARRYEPRHFPHVNLGRLFAARRRYGDAVQELRKAFEHAPGDPAAAHLLRELVSQLNGSLGALPSILESPRDKEE